MRRCICILLLLVLSACGGTMHKRSSSSHFSFSILEKYKGKCHYKTDLSIKESINAASACLSVNHLKQLHTLAIHIRNLEEASPWGYYFDAHYFFEKKQIEQALWYSKKALEKDYKNPILHYQLGRIYYELQDLSLAMHHFNETYKLNPNIDSNNLILANLYVKNHDFENALEHYLKISSSKLKKQNAKNIYLSAFAMDQYDVAKQYIAKIPKKKYTVQMYLNLAYIYQKDGKIDDALDTYKYVLKLNRWQNTTYTKQQISDKIKELEVQKRSIANAKAKKGVKK